MISKRGNLAMDELVKFVLGIIIVVLLIMLSAQLVKIMSANNKEEQARNTLDKIVYEIEKLESGKSKEILIEGPKDWVFMSNEKKLCFCDLSVDFFSVSLKYEDVFYKCLSSGVCKNLDKKISITTFCSLRNFNKGSIWYTSSQSNSISTQNCLFTSYIPYSIYVFSGAEEFFIGSSPGVVSDYDSSTWDGESYFFHIVKLGETLGEIANYYKVNVEDILILERKKNFAIALLEGRVEDPNTIGVKQKIRIPDYK